MLCACGPCANTNACAKISGWCSMTERPAGKIWGSLGGVAVLCTGVLACSAWGYITWQHRQEKKLLWYAVSTRLDASHISDTTDNPVTSLDLLTGQISASVDNITLQNQTATTNMRAVARDIMTWCFLRWGGHFGTRAGSDSLGHKSGIWNSNFENVRCAVMLLALHQVNTEIKDRHQKAGVGSQLPGTLLPMLIALLVAWHSNASACSTSAQCALTLLYHCQGI